jgi:RNA polymerase sigma-70 factor (ECF subfamily)
LADVHEAITRPNHEEWARVIAGPSRRVGDLDIAGEAAAEAFVTVIRRWPVDCAPPNHGGGRTTTANRRDPPSPGLHGAVQPGTTSCFAR